MTTPTNMPVTPNTFTDTARNTTHLQRQAPNPEFEETIEFSTLLQGAFQNYNTVSAVNKLVNYSLPEPNVDENPWEYLNKIDGLSTSDKYKIYKDSDSLAEARLRAEDVVKERQFEQTLAKSGASGVAAVLIAGVVDPTMVVGSGAAIGSKLFTLSQIPTTGSRLYNIARGASIGSIEAGVSEAIIASANHTVTGEDVAYATIFGAGIGGTFGAFAPTVARETMVNARKNILSDIEENTVKEQGRTTPIATSKIQLLDKDPETGVTNRELSYNEILKLNDTDADVIKNTTNKLQLAMAKLGTNLWGNALNIKNPVINVLATTTLEGSIAGGVKRTAAMTREMIETKGASFNTIHHVREAYISDKLGKVPTNLAVRQDLREAFNDALVEHTLGIRRSTDPRILEAAESSGKFFDYYTDNLNSAFGSQLKKGTYALPRIPSARKFRKIIDEHGEEELINRLIGFYKPFKQLGKKDSRAAAKAIINRALHNTHGAADLTAVLSMGNRADLEDLLLDGGMHKSQVDRVLDTLQPKSAGAREGARLARRIEDVDNTHYVDLFETDMSLLQTRYNEEMSGRIALAGNGIYSQNDIMELREMAHKADGGKNTKAINTFFDDYTAAFYGKPARGGIDSRARRILQAVSLSLYDSLGFAQLMEVGNTLSEAGFAKTLSAIPMAAKMTKAIIKGDMNDPLIQSMNYINQGMMSPYLVKNFSLHVTEDSANLASKVGVLMDNTLGSLQKVQSYTSMFNYMTTFTRALALYANTGKILTDLTTVTAKGNKYLKAVGIPEEMIQEASESLKKYPPKRKGGAIIDTRFTEWENQELAGLVEEGIIRGVNVSVQKALVGEGTPALSSTVGAFLGQSMAFSLTAVTKQVGRTANLGGDAMVRKALGTTSIPLLGYMLNTYSKSLTKTDPEKYREKQLSANKLFWGVMNYSAMTPFASNIGNVLNTINVLPNEAAPNGGQHRGLNIPAISVLQRFGRLVNTITDTDSTAQDIRGALTVLPFTRMLGAEQTLDAVFGTNK